MAYDEVLAQKVREALVDVAEVTEKTMFGGVAFMIDKTMCLGVDKDDLIVRCHKSETEAMLKRPGVRKFDLSGRPIRGWLLVGPEATKRSNDLSGWIKHALAWRKQTNPSGNRPATK